VPLLLMTAVYSGDERQLRLIPAAAYLGVAAFFHASLRGGASLIEHGVRTLLPFAPEFVRSYFRALTLCWAGFFVLAALVIGRLALIGDPEAWRFATGWGIAIAMLVVMPIEFLIRKPWLRYYYFGGPFDRFWSRLFPAEATCDLRVERRIQVQHPPPGRREHSSSFGCDEAPPPPAMPQRRGTPLATSAGGDPHARRQPLAPGPPAQPTR